MYCVPPIERENSKITNILNIIKLFNIVYILCINKSKDIFDINII